MKLLKIIGICGSLRQDSFNRKILVFSKQFFPKDITFEIVEIGNLPIFNQDLEANPPHSVIKFREEINSANGILFAANEHNYSVSAALKNAIEWGSRPYVNAVMNKKPIAIISASTGMIGGARAQNHLRQISVQVDMYPLNKPELIITFVKDKFDEKGNLTDVHTQEKIKELIQAFIPWVKKFSNLS